MSDSGRLVVLVVEPHQLFRELMVELVGRLPLVRVVQANTAEGAIARTREELPSIVLVDAALPDLPVMEVVRRLKALAPQSDVVVVSDQPVGAYREMVLRSGAALCLRKEGLAAELLPALLQLIDHGD